MAESAIKIGDIRVDYIYPPIPCRQYDWCAYRDSVGPEGICGWGSSSMEAITDLMEQEENA